MCAAIVRVSNITPDTTTPGNFYRATIRLQRTPPRGITQSGETLNVSKHMKIRFVFPKSTGFSPIGITFRQMSGTGDPDGGVNMETEPPSTHHGNPSLQITDKVHDKGMNREILWKYSLSIQPDVGPTGVIDPEICNTEGESKPHRRRRKRKNAAKQIGNKAPRRKVARTRRR